MRRSALVPAAILFLSSFLLAQHSSGGGGGFSGGSHSSSGGFSGSGSSHASSGASSTAHSSTSAPASSRTESNAQNHVSSVKSGTSQNEQNGKKGFFSFLHHRKPEPTLSLASARQPICQKGFNCGVCPASRRTASGGCGYVATSCGTGLSGSRFSCNYYRQNDCSRLADQLAAQQRLMRGQSDPGETLFYQTLQQQYNACLWRNGIHPATTASLLDNLRFPRDGH
jgi:hypothetical protein